MTADPRTPGQVAREAWWAESMNRLTMNPEGWDAVAAAVLAHDAATRRARGEVVVRREDVLGVLVDVPRSTDGLMPRKHLRAAFDAQESP